MKTIFIPIFYKQQARNILETDVYRVFSGSPDVRLVIFVPDFKSDYFQRFARFNVVIQPVPEIPETFSLADRIFRSISLNYIDSETLRLFRKRYGWNIRLPLRQLATKIWGHLRWLRQISKALDERFVGEPFFGTYFDRERPDLVFLPHLVSKYDRALLRQAKKRGIPTIGAVHSWDNITAVENPVRLLPDHLMAYNEIIRDEMVRYLDAKPERITITGLPHFDYYVTDKRSSREELFSRLGLDGTKKVILFSPAGARESSTDWHIVSIIQDAIADGRLPKSQLLVREHPVADMDRGKLLPKPFVHFDRPFTEFSSGEKVFKEITEDDMAHLANSLFWSDVTINICSTLSIDAAAFDKPVINVAFDGWAKNIPFRKSIRRFYKHDHYVPILKSGGVRLTNNAEELVSQIRAYLDNPALDREGRARMIREQCFKLDGKSGERVANAVLAFLE